MKTKMYMGLTKVDYQYNNCFVKYDIKSSSDFEFSNLTNIIILRNDLRIISLQKIIYSGDNDAIIFFNFKLKGFYFPLSKQYKAFYCYIEPEIKIIEKILNTAKIKPQVPNVIAIRDKYDIYKTFVDVATFITFVVPEEPSIEFKEEFKYYLAEITGLEIINIKCNNVDMSKEIVAQKNSSNNHYITADAYIEPGQYFCTLELFYKFVQRPVDEEGTQYNIEIYPDKLCKGGRYELCINYSDEDYDNIVFGKDVNYRTDHLFYRIHYVDYFNYEQKSQDDYYNVLVLIK